MTTRTFAKMMTLTIDAIAAEAAMLLRSDARQSQQLPKCVDRPMAWVRKGCYRR